MEFLRTPPVSHIENIPTQHFNTYEYYVRFIDTLPIPENCVEKVVVNPMLKEFLSTQYHGLANPDTLLSLARISSYKSKLPSEMLQVPVTNGRALPLAHTDIMYAKNLHGSVIIGKGGGPSGKHYARGVGVMVDNTAVPSTGLGLFGVNDAKYDTETSNAILSAGGRAALSLGYLHLNSGKYRSYLLTQWNSEEARKIIDTAFKEVENNGDDLAYHERLGGNAFRLDLFKEPSLAVLDDFGASIQKKRIRMALAGGARSLLKEFRLPESTGNSIQKALEELSTTQQISYQSYMNIRLWSQSVLDQQLEIVSAINEKPDGLQHHACQPKDVDFSLKVWDFEKPANANFTTHDDLRSNFFLSALLYQENIYKTAFKNG